MYICVQQNSFIANFKGPLKKLLYSRNLLYFYSKII